MMGVDGALGTVLWIAQGLLAGLVECLECVLAQVHLLLGKSGTASTVTKSHPIN